jgi:hypothetical protein
LLNARLRFQYINSEKKFDIHFFSRFVDNNIPTNFANLNNKYLISLIEGKTTLSFFLFNSKQPSIILGNSLKKSVFDLSNLIVKIKSMFPKINVLEINLHCNSESLRLLNLDIDMSSHVTGMGQPKNYLQRRNRLDISSKPVFSFMGGTLMFSNIVDPGMVGIGNSEIHLNLEGRPQISRIVSRSRKERVDYAPLRYINELLNSPKLFNISSSQIVIKDNLNSLFFKESMHVNLFPVKSNLERHYLSRSFLTTFTDTMIPMQVNKIEQSTNFYE